MRFLGLIGLLLALLVVGLMAARQMKTTTLNAEDSQAPVEQFEDIQNLPEQYKESLDAALQESQRRLEEADQP